MLLDMWKHTKRIITCNTYSKLHCGLTTEFVMGPSWPVSVSPMFAFRNLKSYTIALEHKHTDKINQTWEGIFVLNGVIPNSSIFFRTDYLVDILRYYWSLAMG